MRGADTFTESPFTLHGLEERLMVELTRFHGHIELAY